MKIYFDEDSDNIVLGTTLTGVSGGTLEAVDYNGQKIGIRYKKSTTFEVVVPYTDVSDEFDNPAGNTLNEVLVYLNTEFDKDKVITGGNTTPMIIVFTKSLSGTEVEIPYSEHQIKEICGIRVTSPTGTSVDVASSIIDNVLYLSSNINLTGYTLSLSGFSVIRKFIKPLTGFSVSIPQSEHNIENVIFYDVRKTTGQSVSVEDLININNTITIQSNVNLLDCILTIKGL